VIVIVAILATGLIGLLLLNTALAQGSFRLNDLQRQTSAMQDREQQLQIAVDAANDPARLAAAAIHLGLVPAQDPGYVRLSDGRILGAPQAATAPPKHQATPSAQTSVGPSGKPTSVQPATGATTHPTPKPTPQGKPRPTPVPTPGHGTHR
jgi:hypothetical protein